MKTESSLKSGATSCCRCFQESKHWNARDWDVHIFASCSFEQATESDHIT
jgi:hypothetical protein